MIDTRAVMGVTPFVASVLGRKCAGKVTGKGNRAHNVPQKGMRKKNEKSYGFRNILKKSGSFGNISNIRVLH